MPTRSLALQAILLFVLLPIYSACDDSSPYRSEALLSRTAPGEKIPALWRPAALRVAQDGRVFIAEQASHRVRALRPSGELETILDVDPRRGLPLLQSADFDLDFGMELLQLGDGTLLLANRGGPLVLFDPDGQLPAQVLGNSNVHPPAPGVLLGDAVLSSLCGIQKQPDSDVLFLCLDNRFWRVADNGLPMAQRPLDLVAGDGTRGRGPTVGDAQMPFELGAWVGMAVDPEGTLTVVEGNRLRCIRDGRVLTLTGEGFLTGAATYSFEEYHGAFRDISHGFWAEDGLTFVDNLMVRRFEIDSLDFAAGSATGTVYKVVPFGLSEIGGIDLDAQGDLTLTYGLGGSLLSVRTPGEFQLEYGPALEEALFRYFIDDGTLEPELSAQIARYRSDDLLLPQSLISLWGGDYLLVNQPLARMISAVNREADLAMPFWGASALPNGFGPATSDGNELMYIVQGALMQRLPIPRTQDSQALQGGNVFRFKRPLHSGVPGAGRNVAFLAPFSLSTAGEDVLLFQSDENAVLRYQPADGWVELEIARDFGVSTLDSEGLTVPFMSLNLEYARSLDSGSLQGRVAALKDPIGGDDLIAAGHSGDGMRFGAATIERKSWLGVIGGGVLPLQTDLPAQDLRLKEVNALAYLAGPQWGVEFDSVLVAADDGSEVVRLFVLDGDGAVQPLGGVGSTCSFAPAPDIGWLVALPAESWPPRAALLGLADGRAFACTDVAGQFIGSTALVPNQWLELSGWDSTLRPHLARDTHELVRYRRYRGLHTLWFDAIGSVATASRRVDLDLDLDTEVSSMTVSDDGQMVSLTTIDAQGGIRLLEGAPDGASASLPLPSLRVAAGGGLALPSEGKVWDVAYGLRPESIALDAVTRTLYVAMADTGTLWALDAGDDGVVGPNDAARLLWHGPPLFQNGRGPRALAASGGRVWASSATMVYAIKGRALEVVAGGGAAPVANNRSPEEVSLGEIRAVVADADGFAVLTGRELFALDEQGKIVVLAQDGELQLVDGTVRSIDVETASSPAMVRGREGELLIVSPATHELLSVHLP